MKAFWTGTDSLMLVDFSMRKWYKKPYWIIFRLFARLLNLFVQEHYAVSTLVASHLNDFGFKNVVIHKDHVWHEKKYPKIEHEGFNVLYCCHTKGDREFNEWLYGRDIYLKLKAELSECNFIEVDGSQDMSKFYPITDFYLRPNRHDGHSRMIEECKINEIPYYHSNQDPSEFEAEILIIKAIAKKIYGY